MPNTTPDRRHAEHPRVARLIRARDVVLNELDALTEDQVNAAHDEERAALRAVTAWHPTRPDLILAKLRLALFDGFAPKARWKTHERTAIELDESAMADAIAYFERLTAPKAA